MTNIQGGHLDGREGGGWVVSGEIMWYIVLVCKGVMFWGNV